MRTLRLLSLVISTAAVALVAVAAFLVHMAQTGQSPIVLEQAVRGLGRVLDGQRTEQVRIDLALHPERGELEATAHLRVRIVDAERSRLSFLLNDGLELSGAWLESDTGEPIELVSYPPIGPLRILELPQALPRGANAHVGIRYRGDPRASLLGGASAVFDADEVILRPSDLWVPTDLQGFFRADVSVTLPESMDLVHNGEEIQRADRGTTRHVRWSIARPVAGMALAAGSYRVRQHESAGRVYRLHLPDGVSLDAERILTAMRSAHDTLEGVYGGHGFPHLTLFLSRRIDRPFNGGDGLMGIPTGRFHDGDYGYGIIAHEIAHNWWGATVAERWLEPESGGQWIVEGFAELSRWIATEERFGENGLLRRLSTLRYDPERTGIVSETSMFDNLLDPRTRPTIYRKGAYVASLLRQIVGPEAFSRAARAFLERFRHQQVGDRDLEIFFAEMTRTDLGPFFERWVRSDSATHPFDPALEPRDGNAVVRNYGTAPLPGPVAVWRYPPDGEPVRDELEEGATTPIGNAERVVLDPLRRLPDMYRVNNEIPRERSPWSIERSVAGDLLILYGRPGGIQPVSIEHLDANGRVAHEWAFERGIRVPPRWSQDGTRILVGIDDDEGVTQIVALHLADGQRRRVASGRAAAGFADGTVVAREDSLLNVRAGRKQRLLRTPGARPGDPRISPDGAWLAYTVRRPQRMELRVSALTGEREATSLFTWHDRPLHWRWAPGGDRLYAVVAGDWDWQLWEIPLDTTPPRRLVQEAASIPALAVSPSGDRIAVVAAPELDYAWERRRVFVFNRDDDGVADFDLGFEDAEDVAWQDADTLVLITSDARRRAAPQRRRLRTLSLPDGALADFRS